MTAASWLALSATHDRDRTRRGAGPGGQVAVAGLDGVARGRGGQALGDPAGGGDEHRAAAAVGAERDDRRRAAVGGRGTGPGTR